MNTLAVLSSWPGAALLSALLFGASTPLAKLLLGTIDPWMLAGLLYLGSGVGLTLFKGLSRLGAGDGRPTARLGGRGWLWLGLAILSGGVAGPVLLMIGLTRISAAAAALLLNLEAVLTAAIAWLAFRENIGRRIALGMAAIVSGGMVLALGGGESRAELLGALAVAAACLAWAVDNNLTGKVSLADPVRIALIKGCVAGTVNVLIAVSLGSTIPPPGAVAAAAAVGFGGYGVSLVLFILALRHIGAARTGAYFSVAPFFGGLIALALLREPLTGQLVVAGAMMAVGVWLHITERHEHEHVHESAAHEHSHVHDEHHQHAHEGTEPPGEPHTHWHVHVPLRHSHPHYPDAHHRHGH